METFLTIYFKRTLWMHCTVESIWQFILLISCINSAQMSVSLKSLAYQVRFGSKLLFRNFQDVSKWGRLCCGQFDFLVKFCGFQYLQSKAKRCSKSKKSSLLVPCEHEQSRKSFLLLPDEVILCQRNIANTHLIFMAVRTANSAVSFRFWERRTQFGL